MLTKKHLDAILNEAEIVLANLLDELDLENLSIWGTSDKQDEEDSEAKKQDNLEDWIDEAEGLTEEEQEELWNTVYPVSWYWER